ncbi:flavin-containing monooxygenase [Nitrosomonas ureae]|uniref:Predicted flavoprotein CzcO associated with the cation diffusion facilitator CzcD n=1 Tax=Nitrosomonas ureae TaxID=44577 RepID=A0A1H5TJG7_9PROT|nr:NAD(P)-binding domain-containing protein [Nitrosomonas ureae]SEF62906.1 Predicted flavoprotein CzcO associated with the cation diffusion facilitator CzcD [Nitrosomonas ureae]
MHIAIIGAGCSGLTAIKHLVQAGLKDIVCYEKNDRIGGNWIYAATPSHSSICSTTHTISSKSMSQFSDFPMPDDYPDYPSHQQILAYFQAYARHFQLEKYIRFNVAVQQVRKIEKERWHLSLSDGTEAEFDCLLIANGHLSIPRHPDWKDDFSGQYLHAHDYKSNQALENKRVLVIGAGNSACDCAVETSRNAALVDMSLRSPQYIIPKLIMGKPTDTFAVSLQWLPQRIQNWLQKISLRIQVGRYRDYGLPEPDFSPTQAHPTINSEIFDKIRHGKIHPRSAIQGISGQTVHFIDGSSAEYDVIIAATGYKISFPFFDRDFIHWEDASNIPLFLRIFHPDHPSLFFIGLIQPQGCIWTLAEAQSQLIGRLLTGKIRLPDNWRESAIAEGKNWAQQFIARPRHALEVHYYPYLQSLRQIIKSTNQSSE